MRRHLVVLLAMAMLLSDLGVFTDSGNPAQALGRRLKRSRTVKRPIRRPVARVVRRGAPRPAKRPTGKAAARKGIGFKGFKLKLDPKKLKALKGKLSRRGFHRWGRNKKLKVFRRTFKLAKINWKRFFTSKAASLAQARLIARMPTKTLEKMPVTTLARVLFVLEMEDRSTAGSFKNKVSSIEVSRRGQKAKIVGEVLAHVKFCHQLYDVPCRGALSRQGTTWPPRYECKTPAKAPSDEPSPVIALRGRPRVIEPASEADVKEKDVKGDARLAAERRRTLKQRDGQVVDAEVLRAIPSQFCVGDRCYRTHAEVAAALYGGGKESGRLPVFCAPRQAAGRWEIGKVRCSTQWLDTLGGWKPWLRGGKAAPPPEPGVIPPWACIGAPHLLGRHMVLPSGGWAGRNGFVCRNRIFRILARNVEKDARSQTQNIARLCTEMRQQVWGEKYGDINAEFQKWCRKQKKPYCLPKDSPELGPGGVPKLPFMLLSREELLFFYGHRKLFCRADRPGLTHFLYNQKWAGTFTCDVPRGLLEAGPFEEGVQACAVAPYEGDDYQGSALDKDHLKARLHCWKFSRPTCEDISRDQTKDDIRQSSVFDAYDALLHARRTRQRKVWELYDLKDAEKLTDFEDRLAFTDTGKDEGVFGVKDFCRFVGGLRKVRCGYNKKTIAQWYDLHRDEPPEGCGTGVCARGAYRRGYYCGLFSTKELFNGKAYWMCGIDSGLAGRRILAKARAVCVGGGKAMTFQSAKGDRGSLQCYERRFRWGESETSEDVLRRLSWPKVVEAAARIQPQYEEWLHAGPQLSSEARELRSKKPPNDPPPPMMAPIGHISNAKLRSLVTSQVKLAWLKHHVQPAYKQLSDLYQRLNKARKAARDAINRASERDERELVNWARRFGHTLGHQTSLRIGLMRSNLTVINALKILARKGFREIRAQEATFTTLGKGTQVTSKLDEAICEPDRAKDLQDLVKEVVAGDRPADGRWYEAVRALAREGGVLRIDPDQLGVMLRVHHLFDVLAAARRVFLDEAKAYADAVFNTAKRAQPLSRIELHERARGESLPWKYKGPVFCVSERYARNRSGLPYYVCASSPLLVVGTIERRARSQFRFSLLFGKRKKRPPPPTVKEATLAKRRAKLRLGWCYGGTRGRYLYGYSPSKVLSEPYLSSPFLMDIPSSVIDVKSWFKKKGRSPAPRKGFRLRMPRRSQRAAAGGSRTCAATRKPARRWGARGKSAVRKRGRTPAKATPRFQGLKLGVRKSVAKKRARLKAFAKSFGKVFLNMVPRQQWRASVNWLKCSGFQYSDESWEEGVRKTETAKKQAGAAASAPPGPSSSNAEARKETAKIMKKVGGLIISLVKLVLPRFGDALERVQDMAHIASSFYDRWVGEVVKKAEAQWRQAADALNRAQGEIEKARKDVSDALEKYHKADLAVAAAPPPAKKKFEAKKVEAQAALNAARAALKAKENGLKAVRTAAANARTLKGSGDLLNPMLDDLVTIVTKRVVATISPSARNLLSQGFKFIRSILDPIAKSVISALAGIPFVGAALAALGQVAYSMAMNWLEDAAFDALLGLVERILAKLVRSVISPIFTAAKGKLLALVYGVCATRFPGACPKGGKLKFSALPPRDRWLNRALACKRGPIIDERVYREARLARRHILGTASQMRRQVASLARDLADRYLARFGYTYDTWMAAVASGPTPQLVAKAAAMSRALQQRATRARAAVR